MGESFLDMVLHSVGGTPISMKRTLHIVITALNITLTLITTNILAQDSPQWHLPEGAKARLGIGYVSEVDYTPDGTMLAVASGIGIWIYDAKTGKELKLLPGQTGLFSRAHFSSDGKTIACVSGDKVRLWEVSSGRLLRTITGKIGITRSLYFGPDDRILTWGSENNIVFLWEINSGRRLHTLDGQLGRVHSSSFSPDGNILALGSND